MKVEQEGTDFAPITITIESHEEANIMWAMLNATWSQIMENAAYVVIVNDPDPMTLRGEDIAYQMFCAFDDIHPQEKQ